MPTEDLDISADHAEVSDEQQHSVLTCSSSSSSSQKSKHAKKVDPYSSLQIPAFLPRKCNDNDVKKAGGGDPMDVTVSVRESSIWKSTRREKLVLLCLALCNMIAFMTLAIMAPFYPKEANDRGVSDTISGFIFGIFALTQFVTSPLFGKLIPVAGAKFLFTSGTFFGGACCVLFGILDYLPKTPANRTLFIVYSFVLRIFMSLGCTAAGTANFAICAFTFPKNAAMALGFLETFTGLGLMVGPALGGVLYDLGGFTLPFVVIGSVMILSVPIYICVLPSDLESEGDDESVPIGILLKDPVFLVTSFGIVVGAIIWVVLDPTLEPHLRQFNLSSTVIGLVFLLLSASYAICAPLWGWVADKMSNSSPLIIIGFYVNSVSMLFLGPSPLIQLEEYQELWLNLVALLVTGLSISLAVVPTFDRCIASAEKCGIEMNMGANSAIAGLWISFYALGEFIGPTASGILVDTVGFPWTMTYVSASSAVAGTAMLMLYIYETRRPQPPKVETETVASVSDADDVITERTRLLDNRSVSCYSTSDTESAVSSPARLSRQLISMSGRSRPRSHRHMRRVNGSGMFNRSLSNPSGYLRNGISRAGYESM